MTDVVQTDTPWDPLDRDLQRLPEAGGRRHRVAADVRRTADDDPEVAELACLVREGSAQVVGHVEHERARVRRLGDDTRHRQAVERVIVRHLRDDNEVLLQWQCRSRRV